MELPRRKSTRIPGYDYSTPHYYFITICAHEHRCIFGSPDQLNSVGKTVQKHIQNIPRYYQQVFVDKYVVMPNHIHMILVLEGTDNPSVTQIIGQFKTGVTKELRLCYPGRKIWQRSFHDHVIRNQASYEKIWNYIEGNPQCWHKDCFFQSEENTPVGEGL